LSRKQINNENRVIIHFWLKIDSILLGLHINVIR